MNNTEMKDRLFEIMLRAAVEEDFNRELQKLPKEEDLADDCELSLPTRIKIEKMIRESYRHSILFRVGKIAKKAAVVAAIIVPVSLGSLLSVEASRNAIFNALLEWKSDHADIRYQEEGASSDKKSSVSDSIIEPAYLPNGFAEARKVTVGHKTEIEYQNQQGEKILLSQGPLSEGGNLGVDTEHTTEKEIEINGEKAFLFTADSSGGNSYLAWNDHSRSLLLSSEIPPEQLVKIAESMGK